MGVFLQFIRDNMAWFVITIISVVGIVSVIVALVVTGVIGKKKITAVGGTIRKRFGLRTFLTYGLIALIITFVFCGNYVLFSFKGAITQILVGFGDVNVDSEQAEQTQKNSDELCVQICEDGFTLLKNDNNVLPLSNKKINVFGWRGSENGFIYQGAGSGGGTMWNLVHLYDGLVRSGIELNHDLVAAYNALPYERQGWSENPATFCRMWEAPQDFYTDELMSGAQSFSDTAMVVIGRNGAEGLDMPMYQMSANGIRDTSKHYLELSPLEETMLTKVTQSFDKVIVVLNVTNVMECGFLNDYDIDACIAMYAPGTKGVTALGNILQGKATPSGKTVDTWAYDITTSAAFANSGTDGTHQTKKTGIREYDINYANYAESVYVGYGWYETAYEDGFWDSAYAKSRWGIEHGYDDVVQFPFGYGLSYTDFDWTVTDVSIPQMSNLNADSEITFTVWVQNIGTQYSGKDVVELYYSVPYNKGGIEKPSIKLGAFAKTGLLPPGAGEELKLSVKLSDMSSYDCYDRNNNKFMGYEVEAGDYVLSLRTDAHNIKKQKIFDSYEDAVYTYKVENGIQYANDPDTGAKVENRFTTYTNPVSGASSEINEKALSNNAIAYSVDAADSEFSFSYMTRRDFATSFPAFVPTKQASETFYEKSTKPLSPRVNSDDVAPAVDSTETSYTLADFIYEDGVDSDGKPIYKLVDYDDKKWDDLVSQLSVDQMEYLCTQGGFGSKEIASIGKPLCVDKDGPCGFSSSVSGTAEKDTTNFPCATLMASTWDWKIAYQFGLAIGEEGNTYQIDGWYGPAANIHRTPLNGRNFEYYSEDPYISGIMCSYSIYGASQRGVYAWLKHFVLNENEGKRHALYQWTTEQALREIYMKPFEMAVKIGKTAGIMTSYGRVGSVRASGSYALNTLVLRGEWGFKGAVISDFYEGGAQQQSDECIRAGNDMMLLNGTLSLLGDKRSATAIKALHDSTKHILYAYVSTRYTAMTALSLDLTTVIGTRTQPFEWWIPIVIVLDSVLVVGGIVFCVFITLNKRKKKETTS